MCGPCTGRVRAVYGPCENAGILARSDVALHFFQSGWPWCGRGLGESAILCAKGDGPCIFSSRDGRGVAGAYGESAILYAKGGGPSICSSRDGRGVAGALARTLLVAPLHLLFQLRVRLPCPSNVAWVSEISRRRAGRNLTTIGQLWRAVEHLKHPLLF